MQYKYVTPNSEIESEGKVGPYISNACVSSIMQITNTYLFFGRHMGQFCNAELHPEYVRLSAPQPGEADDAAMGAPGGAAGAIMGVSRCVPQTGASCCDSRIEQSAVYILYFF